MKKALLLFCFSVAVLASGFAVPNDVVYSEGEATVRYKQGDVDPVYVGDVYDTGDTVTTGFDGFVELDQAGIVVKINPDTVFALQEKEEAGKKTGVFSLVLGSIKYRFDRILGKEPFVQTGSCVAGVRGTEFSVFAAADGSSLIVVDSGQVEVEAEGESIQLTAEEGVEVRPGEPPGDKFAIRRDQIDYSSWNEDKLQGMLADPLKAMERLEDRLDFYIRNVEEYDFLVREFEQKLAVEREKSIEIDQEEGTDAGNKYRQDVIFPLAGKRKNSYINLRYYSLAALSLRRYVGGRLYLYLKSKYINTSTDETYRQYLNRFTDFLNDFESAIVPHLVEIDL